MPMDTFVRFVCALFLGLGLWASHSTAQVASAAETISPEELELVKQAEAARTQIIEDVYGTVVAIYGNVRQGGGSGFLFDEAGYALTNHHVVAGAGSEGWAGLADGRLYRWHLVGTDPGGDVAIIRLTGKPRFPVARLGLSDTVRVGDWMLAVGNPFVLAEDQSPTVTLGIVSGIERYQAGAGKNTLVYGNCIQIDSSVNPGNSGGPSFDMTGRVIGINGRISAMERGRVNVGVGYAISMRQIRNFIPDLLATKVVQHGTLDAQFSTRRGTEIVCSAINVDSPIARAGLKLGDKLLEFNGTPIEDVNVFTNLITLYPAGWPVEVVYERDGEARSAFVRLIPLPYDIKAASEPMEEEQPEGEKPEEGEKPAEEKADEAANADQPDGEQKAKEKPQPKGPQRKAQPRRGLQLTSQGKIRDEKLNKQVVELLLARWQSEMLPNGPSASSAATDLDSHPLEITEELRVGEKAVGTQRLVLGSGKFFVRWEGEWGTGAFAYDGKSFRQGKEDDSWEEVDRREALAKPLVMAAYSLCSALVEKPLANADVLLSGGDAAQRQRSYRLAADQDGQTLHLWLSMFDPQGDRQIRLLKAGLDTEASAQRPAVIYADWQMTEGLLIPHRRAIVTGLEEAVQLEMITQKVTRLDETMEQLLTEKP